MAAQFYVLPLRAAVARNASALNPKNAPASPNLGTPCVADWVSPSARLVSVVRDRRGSILVEGYGKSHVAVAALRSYLLPGQAKVGPAFVEDPCLRRGSGRGIRWITWPDETPKKKNLGRTGKF